MAIPSNIYQWICSALLTGNVYPEIRAVVAQFTPARELTIRYYLDRPPTDFDEDSVDVLLTEVAAHTSSVADITAVRGEVVYFDGALADFDPLDSIVYTRRED